MSAVDCAPRKPRRLLLLGVGVVGKAFVQRYGRLTLRGIDLPPLYALAHSRGVLRGAGAFGDATAALAALQAGQFVPAGVDGVDGVGLADELESGDVIVDATACDAIAARHAAWLQRGLHVVTANKLGLGADLQRAQAIADARFAGRAYYGDRATVGAGLPLLETIRSLLAGGDRILRIEGVLSGSLAWLFGQHDGGQPFSDLVRHARLHGYTEPDPRIDLSGEDVRRKLLILARSAGVALQADAVRVNSLLSEGPGKTDDALAALDAPMVAQLQQARVRGECLRFIACLHVGDEVEAEVGLRALPASHPLCAGAGTDNRVAIHSERYALQPLVIQGPGAGADVTAAALLDDVLRVMSASQTCQRWAMVERKPLMVDAKTG